jgi:glutamate racemase
MRILFDQGTPVTLRRHLHPNPVDKAAEMGWSQLSNGELIATAEREVYNLLRTTDQNLRYKQNLSERKIGIIALTTTSWPRIKRNIENILLALDSLRESNYIEISFE